MYLCGVDEAGRGALAGPVVAAAVVMKDNSFVSGATDSKLLRENYRDELYVEILNSAKEVTTGIVWNDCIDIKNILKATMTAMKFSLEKLSTFRIKFLLMEIILSLKITANQNITT